MPYRIAIYIFLICWLFYAATIFVLKRVRLTGVSDKFLAVSIIILSQQVFTGWVLGFMGHLFAVELFFSNMFISAALLLISRPTRSDWFEPLRLIGHFFKAISQFCRAPSFLLFLILDLVLIILIIARGVIYPPYSWDGIHYHLGQVGFMLQDGGLGFIKSYPLESYPRNVELTYLWNTIFPRHQLHVNCLQIPYIFLAMFACYGIMRKSGCRRNSSAFAAMFFPTVPIVFLQATTTFIDIATSAFLLCGINFLLTPNPRMREMVLSGLAFGLLVGGKGSGIFQAAVVVIIWIVFTGFGLIRKKGFLKFLLLIVVLVAVSSVNGAYIYIRNWLVFSNPVYPFKVMVAGKLLFEGDIKFSSLYGSELLGNLYEVLQEKSWWGRMYYTWSDPKSWINYGGRLGGFGPVFFTIFLPAIATAFLLAFMQRRWQFLLAIVMLIASVLVIFQLSWWARYIIFFIAGGMLGFAYIDGIMLLGASRGLFRYIALFLALVSCFLYFQTEAPGLRGLRYYLKNGPHSWHPSQFATGGLHKSLFREIYPYEQPGTVIMVDQSFTYYKTGTGGEFACLWNLDFSNRVVYASTNRRDEWFKILEESQPDFVLVGQEGASSPWVKKSPERFELLVEKDGFEFYRVKWDKPDRDP